MSINNPHAALVACIYPRYAARLLAYCRRLTCDEHEGQDLAQVTWGRVLRYGLSVPEECDAFPALATYARNALYSEGPPLPIARLTPCNDPVSRDGDAAALLEREEQLTWLDTKIATLSCEQEVVVRFRLGNPDWTWERIAHVLGMGVNAVKGRYCRALKRLRAEVSSEWC
jgi:DNA-directed RNA polymerase specialized sigma24 family protein